MIYVSVGIGIASMLSVAACWIDNRHRLGRIYTKLAKTYYSLSRVSDTVGDKGMATAHVRTAIKYESIARKYGGGEVS